MPQRSLRRGRGGTPGVFDGRERRAVGYTPSMGMHPTPIFRTSNLLSILRGHHDLRRLILEALLNPTAALGVRTSVAAGGHRMLLPTGMLLPHLDAGPRPPITTACVQQRAKLVFGNGSATTRTPAGSPAALQRHCTSPSRPHACPHLQAQTPLAQEQLARQQRTLRLAHHHRRRRLTRRISLTTRLYVLKKHSLSTSFGTAAPRRGR